MNSFFRFLLTGMAFRTGTKLAVKGLQAAQKPWFFGFGGVPSWAWPLAAIGIAIQVASIVYACYIATAETESRSDESTE